jgi:RNA ligase
MSQQKRALTANELFEPYRKTERVTTDVLIKLKSHKIADDLQWYATEKIHGCNYSFIVNSETDIAYAHRNQTTDVGIFDAQLHYATVEPQILNLFRYLKRPFQIYGEYFGANVILKPTIRYFQEPVEGEVEKHAFKFFELKFIDTDTFATFDELFTWCNMFKIPTVPILATGTLKELLELPRPFKSVVSEIETDAEGYVLKPKIPIIIDNNHRVCLKLVDPRFDELKKSPEDYAIVVRKQKALDAFELLQKNLSERVNMVRIEKLANDGSLGIIPSTNKNNFAHLQNRVLNDIVKEYELETNAKVDKKTRALLIANIVPFIKQYFNLE